MHDPADPYECGNGAVPCDVLHLARNVRGASVQAIDGEIGTLDDFYFEEQCWTIRYLLVDTGKWMNGRRQLLSPMSVAGEWNITTIPLRLTRDEVQKSPAFDPHEPLSHEIETKESPFTFV